MTCMNNQTEWCGGNSHLSLYMKEEGHPDQFLGDSTVTATVKTLFNIANFGLSTELSSSSSQMSNTEVTVLITSTMIGTSTHLFTVTPTTPHTTSAISTTSTQVFTSTTMPPFTTSSFVTSSRGSKVTVKPISPSRITSVVSMLSSTTILSTSRSSYDSSLSSSSIFVTQSTVTIHPTLSSSLTSSGKTTLTSTSTSSLTKSTRVTSVDTVTVHFTSQDNTTHMSETASTTPKHGMNSTQESTGWTTSTPSAVTNTLQPTSHLTGPGTTTASGSTSWSPAKTVGASIGSIAVLGLIGALVYMIVKRKKRQMKPGIAGEEVADDWDGGDRDSIMRHYLSR